MANETLQYIKLDYASQKDALLQRIHNRWPGRWNDFLANSIGIVLVDIVAWGLATLAFVVNRIAGENFVPTMTLRESAVRIGALTGYRLRGPSPAVVLCEAALATPQAASATISAGTLIRTSDANAIVFEVAQDYIILPGNLSPSQLVATFSPAISGLSVINTFLSVVQGSAIVNAVDTSIDLTAFVSVGQVLNQLGGTDTYTITDITTAPGGLSQNSQLILDRPWAEASDTVEAQVYEQRIQLVQGQTAVDTFVAPIQTAAYTVQLTQTPVIEASVVVTVNGQPWSQVSAVGVQNGLATVFQVVTFISGNTAVIFGDDSFGAAVPAESVVQVTYRIGGGSLGNINLGSINTTISGLIASLSSPVSVQITNTTATGIGGQDAETLDQARVNIPFYTRTNDRAVTLADYQTIAQQFNDPQFGSVAFARAVVRTENALLEGNVVSIYAWTTGPLGGLVPLSSALKTSLADYLQTKSVGTDFVQILDGTARPVPISLRFAVQAGFTISDTQALILSEISGIINALRPGDPVVYSDLVTAVAGVAGVSSLVMATPLTDLYPGNTTELFTVPQDSFAYALNQNSVGQPFSDALGAQISGSSVQLPVYPIQAWSFSLTLAANIITSIPYLSADASGNLNAQQVRLLGQNLSLDDNFPSVVNLLTGQATLYVIGAPGDLTFGLATAIGYLTERVVNVYVGYAGDNSQTKRRQIRSALQAWSQGFSVGGTIYAARASGISASVGSVTDAVGAVPGVTSVNRVALDTPASSANSVTAASYAIVRIGQCVINSSVD